MDFKDQVGGVASVVTRQLALIRSLRRMVVMIVE